MPTASTTLTIKSRKKADGSVRWFLWVRKPEGQQDEYVDAPLAHLTRAEDRPEVEKIAATYRAALGKLSAEPKVETADGWFNRYVDAQKSADKTDPMKARNWAKWIGPRIGMKPMADVTREDIEQIRDALDAAIAAKASGAKASRTGTALSDKSAMNVWSCLTSSFRAATSAKQRDLRVLDGKPNPCLGVLPPSEPGKREARQKTFVYPNEAALVFACPAIPLEWRRLHAIAAYTYLRPGELRVLTWADVDLDVSMLIHVTKAWDYEDESVKAPKTRKGIRKVPIEPELVPLLKAMRKGKAPTDLVLPLLSAEGAQEVTSTGRKASVDHVAVLFRDHLRAAGLKRPALFTTTSTHVQANFRSWRDSGLTWLAMTGLGIEKISRRAGHSSLDVTDGYVKAAEEVTEGAGSLGTPMGPLPASILGTEHNAAGPSDHPQLAETGSRDGANAACEPRVIDVNGQTQ